jgi:uncharacterized protein (TIGR02391 family)
MTVLSDAIPNPDTLLEMEPEELGGVLLHHSDRLMQSGLLHHQHIMYFDHAMSLRDRHPAFENVTLAILEAMQWLETAGLVMPAPGQNGQSGFRVLTRRGRRLRDTGTAQQFKAASLLPREMIHPKLNEECWPLFVKGSHDLAVFAAFKTVEVNVRAAAGLPDSLTGVDLMRAAFNEKGALADKTAHPTEIKSLENMIAGAFGCIRNPVGHRDVGLDASKGSAEMIVMASFFLRVVDDRVAKRKETGR